MFNGYPWGLVVNVVQPLAPARTRVLCCSFVASASLLARARARARARAAFRRSMGPANTFTGWWAHV